MTDDAWADAVCRDPQDHVVVPEQPWLDGYVVEKGVIRQFVAMPLGNGYSAEEQLAGMKSVAQLGEEKGDVSLPANEPVAPERVVALRRGLAKHEVRQGEL